MKEKEWEKSQDMPSFNLLPSLPLSLYFYFVEHAIAAFVETNTIIKSLVQN